MRDNARFIRQLKKRFKLLFFFSVFFFLKMAAEENQELFLQSHQNGPSSIHGLCFEVEGKTHPILVLGFVIDLSGDSSVCIQTSKCPLSEIDQRNSKGTDWTRVYSDHKILKLGRNRVILDQPVAMAPREKRCFFLYKNQGEKRCILRVGAKKTYQDENLFLHDSPLYTGTDATGEEIPSFSIFCPNTSGFTFVGGVIYEIIGCDVKPAKR